MVDQNPSPLYSIRLRVEHFAITSIILRVPTEHIDSICSLESRLSFVFICSFGILNVLEVIAKTSFFLNPEMLNPDSTYLGNCAM